MSDQDWDDAPSADLTSVEGLDLTIPGNRPIPVDKQVSSSHVPGAGAHAPSASQISSDNWEWGDADYSDHADEVGERQIDSEETPTDTFDRTPGVPDVRQPASTLPVPGVPAIPSLDTPSSQIPTPAIPEIPLPLKEVIPAPSVAPVSITHTPPVPGIPVSTSGLDAITPDISVPVNLAAAATPEGSVLHTPAGNLAAENGSLPPVPPVAGVPVPGLSLPPTPPIKSDVPASVVVATNDDWEDAPVAGVALDLDSEVALEEEVPWLGRKMAGTALPQVSLSQKPIVPDYLGETSDRPSVHEDIDFDPDDIPLTAAADLKPLKPSGAKKKSHKKIRLTERDMEILAFLARYRIANVNLLAQRFGTSETALRNRLPALEREGLITWAWAAQSKPKVWLITSAGLNTVGMSLTAPTVRWGQLRHTLGLTEMGIKFELAGENVLTEREIRAAATRYTPTKRLRTAIDFAATVQVLEENADPIVERVRTALTVPVPGRGFGHIPDMVLVREPYPNGASGSIAIELELTRKGLSEWKTVLTAYRDSGNFDQVYYLVVSSEIKRGLEGVVKALGAQKKIHIMPIVLNDLTADPESTGGGGE